MGKLILFLGNNLVREDGTGILAEARGLGLHEGREVIVIAMDNDRLPPPQDVETVAVSAFTPTPGEDYMVVGNGGMSAQLIAQYRLVAAHARGEIALEVINLQREGAVRMWPQK